ncbi:hypothetical protein [Burkholderia ubonensis]|uniref:hypothetical protein n=1 Tax=Burkholderia ubonensis TaxID=101571 RepID=UPI000A5F8578|nr:hypothetical protein [Burkholderia ubonensis]
MVARTTISMLHGRRRDHHPLRDSPMGFCLLANIAIEAARVMHRPLRDPCRCGFL